MLISKTSIYEIIANYEDTESTVTVTTYTDSNYITSLGDIDIEFDPAIEDNDNLTDHINDCVLKYINSSSCDFDNDLTIPKYKGE
jgi:hypothetical protein